MINPSPVPGRPSRRPAARSRRLPTGSGSRNGGIPGQLHRLVDHALLLIVVAHLDEAGQREILAQRMPLETVIGQDAAQIRMAGEQDAVQIVGSRSNQLASGKTEAADGTGVVSSVISFTRMRWLFLTLSR
jgi:hypothetical protein